MNVTQKEIEDAVFLIIENLEECADNTLERLSFNIWLRCKIVDMRRKCD